MRRLLVVPAALLAACSSSSSKNDAAVSTDAGVRPDSGPPVDYSMKAIMGLELYVEHGCAACHCNAGEGGCNVDAPLIAGASRASVDANLRFASTEAEIPGVPDPYDPHPLKLSGLTDVEIDDIAIFLSTLKGGVPQDTSSSFLGRGYALYLSGTCISCHLTSGQGSAQGGLGSPIAGTRADPDNLYAVLTGDVPCHPLQNKVPTSSTGRPLNCSILGRYITDNQTVKDLTDKPLGEEDEERTLLAYFLSFISPPPIGGEVEPCLKMPGTICTLAGNGIGGYTNDNIPAAEALFYYPNGLDWADWNKDGSLDLAIVDWNNHRVRIIFLDKRVDQDNNPVTTGGIENKIIVIAGDGKVTGTDALNHTTDIAFDRDQNLYVAGWHNQNIYRYVNPLNAPDRRPPRPRDQLAGICNLACAPDSDQPQYVRNTVLGLPVGIDLFPNGDVIFSENACGRIRTFSITSSIATLQPDNCIDPVKLYVGNEIKTLAGRRPMMGEVLYSGDEGPAKNALFDPFPGPTEVNFGISIEKGSDPERLYVADSRNNVIRYVNLKANPPTVHLFAGVPRARGYRDGPAKQALFNYPVFVYAAPDRSVYVVDQRNNAIRKVSSDGQTVTTVAGTPPRGGFTGDNIPALRSSLNAPGGVIVHPDGRIFIADTNNNRIRVVYP